MYEKLSAEAGNAFMDWSAEELEHFEDCYMGDYDSEEDYVQTFVNEHFDLSVSGE